MATGEAPDLKLKIEVEDDVGKSLSQAEERARRSQKRINDDADKANRDRINLQKRSADLASKQEEQALNTTLKLQQDIDRKRASSYSNLFDRQRAMAQAQYNFEQGKFKNHKDSLLLVEEKYATSLAAISRREAEYASQPFQQLLSHLGRLTGLGDILGAVTAPRDKAKNWSNAPLGGMSALAGARAGSAGTTAAAAGAAMAESGAGAMAAGAGMSTLVPILGAAVIGYTALARIAPEATKAFEDQERADLRLAAAMRATGNTAGGTVDHMKQYANAMQMVTRFSDDQIEGAQAVALQFDRITSDVFPRAIKAAMDLAGVDGDVAASMETVGRAIQQPETAARMLRSANILLTDSQKEVIKDFERTGRTTEATTYILSLFEKKVGGTAEATALASDKIANRWGEAMEKVGSLTAPVGNAISTFFVTIVEGLANTATGLLDTAKWFTGLGETSIQAQERMAKEQEDLQKKQNAKIRTLTDEQKETVRSLNVEVRRGNIESRMEELGDLEAGYQKRLDLEDVAHAERLRKEGGYKEADALLERVHSQNILKIMNDRARAAEEMELRVQQQRLATRQQGEAEEEQRLAQAANEYDAKMRQFADEKEKAADRLAASKRDPAGRLDLKAKEDELKATQDLELRALKGNLSAQATLRRAHENEMRRMAQQTRREQIYAMMDMTAGLLSAVDGVYAKNKKNAEKHKKIQEGIVVINTAGAVMKTWNEFGGWPWGVVPAGIMAATGALQLAAVEKQQFRSGGYTGDGYPGSEAGTVHRGEYVIPADQVKGMGGPGGVERTIAGGGGDIYQLSITPHPGMTETQARRIGYAMTDGMRTAVRDQALRDRLGKRARIQV